MTAAEGLSALPPAQRQMLAVAILAAALTLSWYAVLKPLHRLFVSQALWRTEVHHDLAESRGKAAIEATLAVQAQTQREVPLWKSFYSGATEEDANVQIQQDLRALGNAAGVSALTLTPLPQRNDPDYIARGVHLNAAMTAEQLKRFGVALRESPHFLRVERLAASAPQTQPPDQNPMVTITMDVYGYSREAAPATANGAPPRGST